MALRIGRKVELRPLMQADAPRLVALLGDPVVNRNLRVRTPVSLAVEREFIAALPRATDQLVLGVAARDDGRLLGVAGLHQLSDPARQAELGLFLGGPEEWGKGFGTEATWLLCGQGFGPLGLNRILAPRLRGQPARHPRLRARGLPARGRAPAGGHPGRRPRRRHLHGPPQVGVGGKPRSGPWE